jgi:hypothetical protein
VGLTEYFIVANSFAAPFVSDQSTGFASADSPAEALRRFAGAYRHPAGLYAAVAYTSAEAYHKGQKPLAQWLCNHEQAKRRLSADSKGGYSYLGHGPGSFEINGKAHTVEHPKQGSVVRTASTGSDDAVAGTEG